MLPSSTLLVTDLWTLEKPKDIMGDAIKVEIHNFSGCAYDKDWKLLRGFRSDTVAFGSNYLGDKREYMLNNMGLTTDNNGEIILKEKQ